MNRTLISVTALALALGLPLTACGQSSDVVTGREAEAPAASARSESRTFRDWYAVCDNGNGCVAYSGGGTGWIRIGLDAGPDARPTIHVGMWPEGEALPGPLVVVIDGKRHTSTPDADDSARGTIPASEVQAVLAELAAARTLGFVSGDQTVEISTAGSSASLLWIDERQGRLDTVTALIRRGQKPASTVPAAPDLPRIVAAAAVSQTGFATAPKSDETDDAKPDAIAPAALEAVPAVRKCRADTAFNEYLQKAVTAARLDANTELWGIPCDGGAYNFSYAYFLTGPEGTNARPATFPGVDGAAARTAEGESDLLVNPDYDPETRTLSAFAKARGMGDCGVSQTWTWTGQAFVLSREQVMQDCWGMSSDFWPTTFRSR